MTRPSWGKFFFDIAEVVSTRSTCLRRQYGCVLVRDKTVISTGYNGAPRGVESCMEKGLCARKDAPSGTMHEICLATHAEQNAIANAARVGVSTMDSELYIKDLPCWLCAKILINAGVKTIHILHTGYPDYQRVLTILGEAGVNVLMHGEEGRIVGQSLP